MRLLSTLATLLLGASLAFGVPAQAQDEDAGYLPEGYEEDAGDDFDDGAEEDGSMDDEAGDDGFDSASEEDESADDTAGSGSGDEDGESADAGFDEGGDDTSEWGEPAGEDEAGDFSEEGSGDDFFSGDSVETVDVGFADEEEEEPEEPWHLYVGAGTGVTTMSLSTLPPDAENDFDSSVIRVRAGMQLFENIDVELQVGAGQDAEAPDEVTTDSYYGLFVVPSTSLFDVVEISLPVGYARTTVEEEDFNSAAFGINLDIPVRYYMESLPDIRVVAGWMIYYQNTDARLYGFNVGLRYDFDLGGDPDWEEGW